MWKSGGGWLLHAFVADPQHAAVACSTSGSVAWYKLSGRCHESTHVHPPWNTMSKPGMGGSCHTRCWIVFWSRTSILLWQGGRRCYIFHWKRAEFIKPVICILIKLWDCLLIRSSAHGGAPSSTFTSPKAQGRAASQVENIFAELVTFPEHQDPQY